MPKIYTLQQKQFLPVPVAQAWDFFSSPHNLKTITPPSLQLKITSKDTGAKIFQGQIITYKVKPLFGIPLSWKTEITAVKDQCFFVDEQRTGPYAYWHHEHYFEEVEGGTLMYDKVDYRLPFGLLGTLGVSIVKKELDKIFEHRRRVIENLFGKN